MTLSPELVWREGGWLDRLGCGRRRATSRQDQRQHIVIITATADGNNWSLDVFI